jgi:hypothetical protein
MGYHGIQCFLSKWDEVCDIPVLKLLNTLLLGNTTVPVLEEHSLLLQWLSSLHEMCEDIRRTRPWSGVARAQHCGLVHCVVYAAAS